MFFSFKSGQHFVYFKVENNQMFISNERTNYQFKPLKQIFPPHIVKILNTHVEKMNKEEFRSYVVDEFRKMKYELKAFSEGSVSGVQAKSLTPI